LNAQQIYHRQFTTESGLPNNTVYAVTELKNGNILIGTDNGMAVFNGTEFKNYGVSEGLFNPYVTFFSKPDKSGNVFLNTHNGEMQMFGENKIHNTGIKTISNNYFIYADEQYIYQVYKAEYSQRERSRYSINIYDKKNYKPVAETKSNYNNFPKIQPYYFQNDEPIKTKNRTATYKNKTAQIPDTDQHISEMVFREKEVVYILFDEILRCDFRGNIIASIPIPKVFLDKPFRKIYTLLDKNDQVWINFQQAGLYKMEKNTLTNYSEQIGLSPTQNVEKMFCDSKGRIWIPTFDKGLFLIDNAYANMLRAEGNEQFFTSFGISVRNEIYATSRFNIYKIVGNNLIFQKMQKISEPRFSPFDGGYALGNTLGRAIGLEDFPIKTERHNPFRYKDLVVTTQKSGLLVHRNGTRINHKKFPDFFFRIQNLFPYQNALLYNDGKRLRMIDLEAEKLNLQDYYRSMNWSIGDIKSKMTNADGETYELDMEHLIDIRLVKELPFRTKSFISDAVKKDKNTIFFAVENKLYTMKGEKITDSLQSVNGQNFGYVNKIVPRGEEIWLCTTNGLFRIDAKKGNRIFNKNNLLAENEVNDILFHENYLYIATKNGITKTRISEIEKTIDPPKVMFINYEIDATQTQPALKEIYLKTSENFLKLILNIQNFESPKNQTIQYRFDGDQWFDNLGYELNFPFISSGNHTLQIRLRDINSQWNYYSVQIRKQPPFYLRAWFLISASILIPSIILSIMYLVYRRKLKSYISEMETNNKILELRQRALFTMMNPHFIFNALNAIQYFINSNQKQKGSEFLAKFAKLTRKILDQAGETAISVAAEIERLKIYIELEQLRFTNFKFEISIDENITPQNTFIPNMIVQPFIENAILHGMSPLRTYDGLITLNFSIKNENLSIKITDNGFGKNDSEKNSRHVSKGIKMIKERLEYMSNKNPDKTFRLSETAVFPDLERKGHRVEIIVPLMIDDDFNENGGGGNLMIII
jgi:hypothetical protein